DGLAEQTVRGGELCRDIARRHQPVVPNLDKTLGQDVQQEAAKELVGRDGDRMLAASAEGDPVLVERDESMVGQTDSMGVAAEIPEDLLRSTERRLDVDNPTGAIQLVAKAREATRIGQGGGGSLEPELAVVVQAHEASEEFAAEQRAEDAHRKEEVGARL